jgi:hypothetical protein
MTQASLPSSVPSQPLRQISKASLQTSQSSKDAGKPELWWRAGPRPLIRAAAIGSDETREESGLPPLTRPDFPALIGSTGKNTESHEPATICVFISLMFEVIIGLAYTWCCSCI